MRILVIEDEPSLREGLEDLFGSAGYRIETVADGLSGVRRGVDEAVDLIVLDLMLPDLDGIEVCRRIRQVRPRVPILMLTARGAQEDKVRGLRSGADDYVTKPFGIDELLARVESLARRSMPPNDDLEPVLIDACSFDFGRSVAQRDEAAIPLTAREVSILRWLYLHRERAVSRAELLEHVWGSSGDMQTRTVDMTIANLRQKIERNPKEPAVVVTVKGIGYAWGNR